MADRKPEDQALREARAREKARLTTHRGLATLGETLVPLAEFRKAAHAAGRRLAPEDRDTERKRFLERPADRTPVEGPYSKVAVFGGVYSNHFGLEALFEDAGRRGAEAIYCLGDLGGFGPNPEKIRPLFEQARVLSIQGNYEESLASGHEDCNCGYTDPRDNHFARLSYSYTEANSSSEFKNWMGSLPMRRRIRVGSRELLLVHGSPRHINEFLFASTSPVPFLETLLDQERCDGLLCTHTGLQWHRRLPSGRDVINVGVIGRPANDGKTHVWYCLLEDRGSELNVQLVPLEYDFQGLAAEMKQAELPQEFIETVVTGWWTTCLEVLPARERAASRF